MTETADSVKAMFNDFYGARPKAPQNPRYIKTVVQIRDVPFSELCETLHRFGEESYWEKIRGKWAEIFTGVAESPRVDQCGGPYFELTPDSTVRLGLNRVPGTKYRLCGHMLEFD